MYWDWLYGETYATGTGCFTQTLPSMMDQFCDKTFRMEREEDRWLVGEL